MKSKEEILESGILEQFVLGLTTDQESKEVGQYISQFPELKEHIDTIERAMEVIAHNHAIAPPEHLRAATLNKIQQEESLFLKSTSHKFKWIAGIATTICLIAVGYGWQVKNQINSLTADIDNLQQKITTTTLDCALIKDDYETNIRLLEMYMNENITPVRLTGNQLLPNSDLTVFWDPNNEKACIKINNISDAPKDHIYQIWADVEGEMKSLGTFDNDNSIIDIDYLKNAESLNVTIEKGEGSTHPDVSRLIMSGKV